MLVRLRIRKRPILWSVLAVLAILAGVGLWALWPYWKLSGQFEDVPQIQPSRLYGRPMELAVGERAEMKEIVEELRGEGYRPVEGGERLTTGRYRREGSGLTVFLRTFPTVGGSGRGGGAPLAIRLGGGRVSALEMAGHRLERTTLEPPLLASYYGPDLKERRPVRVDALPEELVEAVLAAEDVSFFSHAGLSFTGIARAAWKNLTGKGPPQGGSTITQQLVKNLYLTHERTLSRKIREAFLAIFVELRHSKRAILQAYLNEIYLGSSNGVNLIGVGAASRAYFGKDPDQLDLPEAATLAGMIQSPANYDPVRKPDRAKVRRNWVLDRMVGLGSLDQEPGGAGQGGAGVRPRRSGWSAAGRPTSPTSPPPRPSGASASPSWTTPATPCSRPSTGAPRRPPRRRSPGGCRRSKRAGRRGTRWPCRSRRRWSRSTRGRGRSGPTSAAGTTA